VDPLVGSTVSHYTILERLGEGGMGVVYKAQDLRLERLVALKFLPPHLAESGECQARFLREARAASALDHPNICTIFEVMETQEGQMFLAMAYYLGTTLKQRIAQGMLPLDEVISIATQIALGLQAAHERGVVHRDIKSSNIMLARNGQVKIMDFGLAKFPGRSQITASSSLMGTLAYMSPEQARGFEADHRSDIWGLGVVLYEMITGRVPFTSEYDQALVYSIINTDAVPPSRLRSGIPSVLEQVVLRCLQRTPENRYQSADEIFNDLLKLQSATGPRLAPPTHPRRRRIHLAAAIAGAIIVVGILVSVLSPHPRIQEGAAVIQVVTPEDPGQQAWDITPDMVEYLLADEVIQSTSNEVFRPEEFSRLHPDRQPAMSFEVEVSRQPVGYKVRIGAELPSSMSGFPIIGGQHTYEWSFFDASAFLVKVIPEVRQKILQTAAQIDIRPSTFTDRWDAFKHYYHGLKAWERLQTSQAKEHFTSALAVDSAFVLAKLHLADVSRFEGSSLKAIGMLTSIRPSLGLLSRVDSLRAEALASNLAYDFNSEVAIRQRIYDMYPLRVESAYRLAEAYYYKCEINEAMRYYRAVLVLDENFAPAHNHLAYCYSHLGDHELALEHFRRYLQLDSTANAYDSMGDGFLAAGILDSAGWAKERGIAIDPNVPYLYWTLFYVRLRQGRLGDASKVVDEYDKHVYERDLKARTYLYRGMVEFARHNNVAALDLFRYSRATFDSRDLGTRSPELHWMLGLVSLEMGDLAGARHELDEMAEILRNQEVSAANYRMFFYKYFLHLRACIAARSKDVGTVLEAVEELDGLLRPKVKDHNSAFDYAYFSTSLGELLLNPPLGRPDYAERRFLSALDYNPHYAPAHLNLWKVYSRAKNTQKAQLHLQIARALWKDADREFRVTLPIPE
jgi:serine/threonine protein kinase/tetratricopeptide (TPR) repeat protein